MEVAHKKGYEMTEAKEKAAEILQSDQTPSQMEAFPSQEARIAAVLDQEVAKVEAKQAELEADKPESVPEKPEKPVEAAPEVKKEPEPAPEPEKAPEEPTEPQLSARERFAEAAKREATERSERQEVKEWKEKYSALENEVAELRKLQDELKNDPEGFFDRRMPADTYEKLTHAYAEGKKPSPERSQLTSLEKKLERIEQKLEQSHESSQQNQQNAWIANHMMQVDQALATNPEDYKVIRDYHAEVERVTGDPVNLHMGIAKIFDEMFAMSEGKKRLTPRECLEIMKEDSEERMLKIRPETPAIEEEKKPEPKKPTKKPAKTLTNALETESQVDDDTIDAGTDRASHLDKVATYVSGVS
jgi:hypothetical protein